MNLLLRANLPGQEGQLPADEYPHLARVGRELIESGFDYAEQFEVGLELILDGLEGILTEG